MKIKIDLKGNKMVIKKEKRNIFGNKSNLNSKIYNYFEVVWYI